MDSTRLSWVTNFIRGIADDVLRDLYVRGKYRPTRCAACSPPPSPASPPCSSASPTAICVIQGRYRGWKEGGIEAFLQRENDVPQAAAGRPLVPGRGRSMIRASIGLGVLLALVGCGAGKPQIYGISFGSFAASPVVVTRLTVNGRDFRQLPLLVDARSDEVMPRANSGHYSQPLAGGQGGQIELELGWVELPTGRAFAASVQVPARELQQGGARNVQLAPIFGPNGLLLITSDPVPQSRHDQQTHDLVQLCAARNPDEDRDYRTAPDSLPDLANVLAEPRPGFGDPVCPGPADALAVPRPG